MQAAEQLSTWVGTRNSCKALGIAPSTFYRHRQRGVSEEGSTSSPRSSPRALTAEERQTVLEELHSARFMDKAPQEVYAELLDEQTYHCSVRTMYRILEAENELRERRNQLRHPEYKKPELVARGPNEVWSWDITKLLGPVKWVYFYLYVILDIFSRYVVGWMVAERENAKLAEHLIEETCRKHGVEPGQLKMHSDRGSPMTAHTMAVLMGILGVTRSFSRPHVSNDNPFSESHFKTLKYHPEFPDRFGCLEHARSFSRRFFQWYNEEHHHSGLALLTPADVHYGRAGQIIHERQKVLDRAYQEHPERFVNGPPRHRLPASEVWINPPELRPTLEIAPGEPFSTLPDPQGLPVFNTYGDSYVDVVPARAVLRHHYR